MSLIPPPDPRPPRQSFTMTVNEETLQLLDRYTRFLGASREHVIQEALRYIAKRDKAFQTWLSTPAGRLPLQARDESLRPDEEAD